MVGTVKEILHTEALDFIMPRHYAGRKPQITKAFGWFINNELVAVATFGKPATPWICRGVCGEEYSKNVYELNRLMKEESCTYPLSQFVAACLRILKTQNWIIVSYADSGMSHHGYIYQACNFIYTGCTKQRTDKWVKDKHARHAKDDPNGIRQIRTAKYRYIYFCTSDKKLKKKWMESLRYSTLPYPKGDNKKYKLGDVYYPVLIDKDKNIIREDDGKHYMSIENN